MFKLSLSEKFYEITYCLHIRCRYGSGDAAKLKTIKKKSSICSKECRFQFSAKSDNIYYPHGKIR